MQRAASLLGLLPAQLEAKLTTRIVSSGKGSSYTVPLSEAGCIDSRDGCAKAIYLSLFEWLVARLNDAQRPSPTTAKGHTEEERFVGLLDIFGFVCQRVSPDLWVMAYPFFACSC